MTNKQIKHYSNISFGILLSVVFAGIGAYGYLKGFYFIVWIGWIIVSIVAGLVTLLTPKILTPLNKLWFIIGQLLGKIISPLVIGIIYFVVITPVGLIGKILCRDELRMRFKDIPTYWIDRTPSGSVHESFKNQF